ncbi:myosin IE [Cavenderia fasciculata]|uniref:Myosin IE n=1 Tax=Cavenderia fasciculata TaxID=261658 RepID=F4PHV6_CACFS|nr:myosin IE [Cavenderia fasciculata]EGG25290.1 myosin IE [Cavenderia fasciculata]|eukprot:XP_004363141.1 myosin IE [Cavenderia fasciculata]
MSGAKISLDKTKSTTKKTKTMYKKGEGVPDFVLLNQITENDFLENLITRHKSDQIYTYIGDVVISSNPFKKMNIYNESDIKNYNGRYKYEMPPHIYALANDAYRAMRQNQEKQCVIISGESGAGKTEASKKIMQFLTFVSKNQSDRGDKIAKMLLESNPLLEAFGNAKTLRNDNSSRFGKYMEMQFDYVGTPSGGKITNYLLEKSRVVGRAQGERNFHIFYQMLKGLNQAKLTELGLNASATSFNYLKNSTCIDVATIDDVADFKAVVKAMETLGLKDEDQNSIWRILASILHIGNITFKELPDQTVGTSSVGVVDQKSLASAAACLKTDVGTLSRSLTYRSINTGVGKRCSVISVPLDNEQAVFSRDALAKALYERLFQWLVGKINQQINNPEKGLVIGILDIYGFEVFEKNSFEQLNINYCNEKLQQLFIELTLKSEQAEYKNEGIEWKDIDYFNNKPICDLIEKRPIGLISLLDEACLIAKSTDQTYLQNIQNNFDKHEYFQSYQSTRDRSIGDGCFRLKHYAGDVTYNVGGFLEKNKDTLFGDLITSMQMSKDPLICSLFPSPKPEDSKKRPETAGSQFRTAINSLISTLLACSPHYVRCIKSNDNKQAGVIDEERVRHQVRYLGLLENVRVRRAGFANRQTYQRFSQRYKMLTKETWPTFKGNPRQATEAILKAHNIPKEEFRMGKTKVFIRSPTTLFYFEEKREAELPRIATLIQKTWRGHCARSRWNQRKAAIKIQLFYRTYRFKKWFRELHRVFNDVKNDPKYGKFTVWPKNPSVLDRAVMLIHRVHNTWRAERMVLALGPSAPAMRQKVLAYDLFKGKKKWNCARLFDADYLEKTTNPNQSKYVIAMQNLFQTYGDTEVLFADYVTKVNPKGVPQKRGVVVTNANIYKHDPKNYKVKKWGTPLADISSISCSPNNDTFVVIHCKAPSRDFVLDVGINGYEAVSEIVTVIVQQVQKLTGIRLTVHFAQQITFNNARPKGSDTQLSFQQSNDPKVDGSQYKKIKSGQATILYK